MNDLYAILKRRGLTTSQHDFSTYYAGKSASYLATTKGLSADALICVFQRLVEERHWLLAIRVAHMILFGRRSDREAA